MKRKVRLRRRITIKLYVFFCVRYPQKIFWQWKHRPFTMTCSYNDIISQKHKNRNPFVSELRHYLNLTPKELEISRISALCAISCLGTRGSWSNFACLAEKRAFRLGCASLSSPPALRFKASPTKRKIRHTHMSMPYFWREGSEYVWTLRERKSSLGFGLLFNVLYIVWCYVGSVVSICEIQRDYDFVGRVNNLAHESIYKPFSYCHIGDFTVDCRL